MKIYLAHATGFDFRTKLYAPLQNSPLWTAHEWVLPHAQSNAIEFDSRPIIKTCDLVVADVSYPSTGTGIEMGWALAHKVPIAAIHQAGTTPSGSVATVAQTITLYQAPENVAECLATVLFKQHQR